MYTQNRLGAWACDLPSNNATCTTEVETLRWRPARQRSLKPCATRYRASVQHAHLDVAMTGLGRKCICSWRSPPPDVRARRLKARRPCSAADARGIQHTRNIYAKCISYPTAGRGLRTRTCKVLMEGAYCQWLSLSSQGEQ